MLRYDNGFLLMLQKSEWAAELSIYKLMFTNLNFFSNQKSTILINIKKTLISILIHEKIKLYFKN